MTQRKMKETQNKKAWLNKTLDRIQVSLNKAKQTLQQEII